MSIFNKVLASVGIGAATVDTKLHKSVYNVNEKVTGIVEVVGGNIPQHIDTIYLTLYTNFIKEVNDTKVTENAVLSRIQINDPFTIEANETRQIPVSFDLPAVVPVTRGKTRVWIATGLDIKNAVDPTDKDFIDIKPTALASNVLKAVSSIGFRLRKVDTEQAPNYLRNQTPVVQEYEFTPTNSTFRRYLDELEIIFLQQTPTSVEILVQVDRRARGLGGFLSESLNMDESFVRLTIHAHDNIPAILEQTIQRYMK